MTPSNLTKNSTRMALRIDELEGVLPTHLFSSLDAEPISLASQIDEVIGTSEWEAPWCSRKLSFGFDFRFDPQHRQLEGLWTTLRTNVLVTDCAGVEKSDECLQQCVALMMMRANWERVVSAAVLVHPPH
jgi:hypothetical protein